MKHRQRKKFFCQILRDWERARRVAEAPVGVLEMNRNRIVYSAPNFVFLQTLPDFIAFLYSNRIDVINVPSIIRLEGRSNAFDSLESVIVLQRAFASQQICFFEMS